MYLAIPEIDDIILQLLGEVGAVPSNVTVDIVARHAPKAVRQASVTRLTPTIPLGLSNLEVMHHVCELLQRCTS